MRLAASKPALYYAFVGMSLSPNNACQQTNSNTDIKIPNNGNLIEI